MHSHSVHTSLQELKQSVLCVYSSNSLPYNQRGSVIYLSFDACGFTAGRTHTSGVMERKLVDYYEMGDIIGEGGFGSVCAGICRQNGDAVSLKTLCCL